MGEYPGKQVTEQDNVRYIRVNRKKYSQSKWLIKGANIYWNIFKCKGKLVSDVARTESTISHKRVSWKMLSMNMGRQ